MGNPWSQNFASIEQLAMELNSIEITTSGLVEPIDFDIFCRKGTMQLNILDKDKIEHNLLPSYGASHIIMPDKLVGYFNTQGYQLVATDVYSLSSQDLQGDESENQNSNKNVTLDNPHGMLLFFKR
ncbi:hypothetical protein LC653_45420, partial [Nostoc sp. CHAB 5784]|nr:hypothetical protein [Nostoc mirabile CHAB5784]